MKLHYFGPWEMLGSRSLEQGRNETWDPIGTPSLVEGDRGVMQDLAACWGRWARDRHARLGMPPPLGPPGAPQAAAGAVGAIEQPRAPLIDVT